MKVGAAKKDTGRAAGVIKLHVPDQDAAVTAETFRFSLDRAKLRKVRRREGRYLLRTMALGQPLSPDTIRINCGRSTCSLPKWSKPSYFLPRAVLEDRVAAYRLLRRKKHKRKKAPQA